MPGKTFGESARMAAIVEVAPSTEISVVPVMVDVDAIETREPFVQSIAVVLPEPYNMHELFAIPALGEIMKALWCALTAVVAPHMPAAESAACPPTTLMPTPPEHLI